MWETTLDTGQQAAESCGPGEKENRQAEPYLNLGFLSRGNSWTTTQTGASQQFGNFMALWRPRLEFREAKAARMCRAQEGAKERQRSRNVHRILSNFGWIAIRGKNYKSCKKNDYLSSKSIFKHVTSLQSEERDLPRISMAFKRTERATLWKQGCMSSRVKATLLALKEL